MPPWLHRTLFFLLRVLVAVLAMFVVLKLIRFTAPFLLAFLFSTALEPVVMFLKTRIHIPRKLGAIISILPILTIFFILRKQFIQGVTLSGMKA